MRFIQLECLFNQLWRIFVQLDGLFNLVDFSLVLIAYKQNGPPRKEIEEAFLVFKNSLRLQETDEDTCQYDRNDCYSDETCN